jgi:ABC-type branched-subunit amino acid transport system substrate-binding protein
MWPPKVNALRACLALLLLVPTLRAQEPPPSDETLLSPEEERGKQIYLTGESPSGEPITALMGDSAVEVPASTLPCANCHGRDGKGNPEGGVTPTNLTWEALSKPYGVRHETGREHPPYTEQLLKRAIAMGFDPAGNELHAAMPRYRMSIEDMEALVSYLRILGTDQDPGVTGKALHLGTLLPPEGPATGVGEAIESVLRAFVAEVNDGGGLYGRQLVLHTHRLAPDPTQRRKGVEAFLDETPVFALVGAFIAGSDKEIPDLLAEREIPLVGPFTLHPQTGFPINRQVFYLLSGLATQGRVLVDLAAERNPARPVETGESTDGTRVSGGSDRTASGAPEIRRPTAVVVFPPGGQIEKDVEAVEKQADLHGWKLQRRPVPLRSTDGSGEEGQRDASVAEELRRDGAKVVFLLHPELATREFLEPLSSAEVYLPGSLAGPEAFAHSGVYLSFPTLPVDQTRQAVEHYRRLVEKYHLPRHSLTTQLATLAAAEVMQEGIKRAGRDVSREKLIVALEGLYEYRTGMMPPITFNPNHRIGARGAYVVTTDHGEGGFQPLGGFRKPEGRR